MTTITNNDYEIYGEKGKGGGSPRAAQEAPNTLQTTTIVRVLEVISEGEIVGLATNDGRSIYFDDTPVQNADQSFNFQNVFYDYRTGLASQPIMNGFATVESEVVVGTTILYGNAHAVVSSEISSTWDAARATIFFPTSLVKQDTSTGDYNGTQVQFAFDRQLAGAGIWETVQTILINDKSTSTPELSYRINRPTGSGNWFFRVRRLSADPNGTSVRNEIQLSRYTRIEDIKEEYPFTAYAGIAVDAKSTGGKIPVRSYDILGIACQVPSNYNPVTRVYTGAWDGTFQILWTQNPAWVLYDILTHDRYGMGDYISASQIDKFSFYDAAQYCDSMVDDGNGGTEPRFTFNYPISSQQEALKLIQTIAGSMQATVVYSNGLLWLNQDRPSSAVRLITKSNVIDGKFIRVGSALQQRHTVARVAYNDKSNKYLIDYAVYEDSDGIARYGYQPTEFAAYGATTHGQALRAGKWLIDTELNQTETLTFKMSYNGFDLTVGDVVKVLDESLVGAGLGGKLVSGTTTSLTLDRPVTIGATGTIDIMLPDATTATATLTSVSGTYTTITLASALAVAPLAGADWIVSSTYQPELFRITTVKQDEPNIISITAITYDPNKYSRIETGIAIPNNPYPVAPSQVVYSPTDIAVLPEYANTGEAIIRRLNVSWTPSVSEGVVKYALIWRKDNGTATVIENIYGCNTTIEGVVHGSYEVSVFAINATGVQSNPAIATYAVDLGGTTASTLNSVTGLALTTGGTTFAVPDLNVIWTNPTSNNGLNGTVKDFKVDVIDNATATTLRTEYIAAVASGATQTYSYTFNKNKQDTNNIPIRVIKIIVAARDTSNNLSTPAYQVFSNPAPAVPSNTAIAGIIGGFNLTFDPTLESDLKGYLVWKSTSSGFTPSSANLAYDGVSNNIAILDIAASTNYHFKLAAYDSFFNKDLSGAGLNISSEFSATSASMPGGVPIVSTLPSSATEGDVVMLTTDGKLYRYHSGAWTSAVPSVDITGTIGTTQIADNSISTAKLQANSVTANEISAGTITSNKLYAGSVMTDRITAAQIAAATITSTQIAATTISASNLNLTTMDGSGNIRAGQTAYDTGTGFFLGYSGATPVFSIGNSAGNKITWNGTTLTIGASIPASSVTGLASVATTGVALSVNGGGTFSGALSAATGSFAGSLSAATGTFGAVTANSSVTVGTTGYIAGGQSGFNTGTGFFLGYSGGYKFSVGNPSGGYMTWDGSNLYVAGGIMDNRSYTAGSIPIAADPTTGSVGAGTAGVVLCKEIYVANPGTLTFTCDFQNTAVSGTSACYFYKDGVAIGTVMNITGGAGWTTSTQNIAFASAGKLQVYLTRGGSNQYCKSFILSCGFYGQEGRVTRSSSIYNIAGLN